MLIYNDRFSWEGWGGKLRLGSGICKLHIVDLKKGDFRDLAHLRPIIVIVSDLPESQMSVKSCAGHIATSVVNAFNIDYSRMLYMEYYPARSYGERNEHQIPEQYEAVDFSWKENSAIDPVWRPAPKAVIDIIKPIVSSR